MHEHRGNTVGEAIHSALQRELIVQKKMGVNISKKEGFQLTAPAGFWSQWTYVAAPFGSSRATNPTYNEIEISFISLGATFPSTYSVEIRGGDRLIKTVGDESLNKVRVIITGNVATQIDIRLKSHGANQRVVINSSFR